LKKAEAAAAGQRLSFETVSMGGRLKKEVEKGSALGKRVQPFLERRQMAPDAEVIEVAKAIIAEFKKGRKNFMI
jgi:hypothetical protein